MTSSIIGFMSARPPDQSVRSQKPDAPTTSEIENSPFRKNLEQAMKSSGTDKSPQGDKSVEKQAHSEKAEGAKAEDSKTEDTKAKESTAKEKTEDSKAKDQVKQDDEKGLQKKKSPEKGDDKAALNNLSNKLAAEKSKTVKGETGKDKKAHGTGKNDSTANRLEAEKRKILAAETASAAGKKSKTDSSGKTGKEEDKLVDKSDKKKKTDGTEVIPFPVSGDKNQVRIANASLAGGAHDAAKTTVKAPADGQKKGKDEPVLTVVDVRGKNGQHHKTDGVVVKTEKTADGTDKSSGKDSNTIVLGSQNHDHHSADGPRSFESRLNASREAILTRELQQTGNDQIVKKASFVLKDNHQGEIKLILKPESLGQVKIHLNMNDNHLVGKIIVENSRVGQIFQNNLANLSRAFEEAGMSSSSLEVSVGNGNRQGGNQQNQQDQPYYSDRLKVLDRAVPSAARYASGPMDRRINLVV